MASNIEELFDLIYDMVDEAKNVPLSSDKCMIERDKALDMLDDIRTRFPAEVKKARELVEKKNDYIASAKREADEFRQKAEDHARRILNEDTLALEARRIAQEIIAEAEATARDIKDAANVYCEDMLARAEECIDGIYGEAKHARDQFRSLLNGVD